MISYIKLEPAENLYIKKNLLQSQLELLQTIKHQQIYKKLRKQELIIKIELKKILEEAIGEFKLLNKLLPKTQTIQHPKGEKIILESGRKSLESELLAIKAKLAQLQ